MGFLCKFALQVTSIVVKFSAWGLNHRTLLTSAKQVYFPLFALKLHLHLDFFLLSVPSSRVKPLQRFKVVNSLCLTTKKIREIFEISFDKKRARGSGPVWQIVCIQDKISNFLEKNTDSHNILLLQGYPYYFKTKLSDIQ